MVNRFRVQSNAPVEQATAAPGEKRAPAYADDVSSCLRHIMGILDQLIVIERRIKALEQRGDS